MTKQMKKDWYDISYYTFTQVIEIVDALIKEYPHLTYKDITVNSGSYYGDTSYPQLEFSRPETDEEERRRTKKSERAIIRKRLQYEALKKEFEK